METTEIQSRVDAAKDRNRLQWNLDNMEKSQRAWLESLKDIHERSLWRHDYASFEDFCNRKLGITRDAGYKKLEAHGIRLALQDELASEPETLEVVEQMSESALRNVKSIAQTERASVVKELAKTGVVTAGSIQAVANPKAPKTAKAREVKKCPHCGLEL